ncbi:hypothetical protein AB1K70_09535 [Bremerella sp. JC770]|uniref:EF-hand domain-containing protein n=1 Tax=Bremerella sp. JC770 TaxID=3232137 RepID=UPI003457447C
MRTRLMIALAIITSTAAIASAADIHAPTVDDMTAALEKGFDALDEDKDGKLPLLEVIRAVRPLGFGSLTETETSRRGSRGRGERGGERGARLSASANEQSGRGGERASRQSGERSEEGRPPRGEGGPMRSREGGEHSHDDHDHSHGDDGHDHGESGRGRASVATSEDAELMVAFDINRDRVIEMSEVKQALQNDLERQANEHLVRDLDRDGQITKQEFAASLESVDMSEVDEDGLNRRARMMFIREDTNQDGVITKEEVDQQILRQMHTRMSALGHCLLLTKIDANLDKKVTPDELAQVSQPEVAGLFDFSSRESIPTNAFYGTIRRQLSRKQ